MSTSVEEVEKDLDFCSIQIGTQTRTIAVGVLALVWLFLAGGSNAPSLPVKPNQLALLAAGGMAILSLVIDYFQYLFGYINSRQVLAEAEARKSAKATFDYTSTLYRLRRGSFWFKQVATLSSVVALFYSIIGALVATVA